MRFIKYKVKLGDKVYVNIINLDRLEKIIAFSNHVRIFYADYEVCIPAKNPEEAEKIANEIVSEIVHSNKSIIDVNKIIENVRKSVRA